MNKEISDFSTSGGLAEIADFRLGSLLVSPSRRLVEGPGGSRYLQPQVMFVFLCLAQCEGQVVTRRRLFDRCWGGAPVGDDSLNRTVTGIRQMLGAVGGGAATLETIPRSGYRLVVPETGLSEEAAPHREQAVQAAYDCWRTGMPQPDPREIAALHQVLTDHGGAAGDWGMLALLLRKAAEYASAEDCSDYVRRCERAARTALNQQHNEVSARVALAGLTPLFGNWSDARAELLEVVATAPDHAPAHHDLAVLEMATGRPGTAMPIIERLLAADKFAATLHYKRLYHLWSCGDLREAEQVAARALLLWPRHPAIWLARYWILLFTDRPEQALRMTLDEDCCPPLPPPAVQFLRRTAELVGSQQSGSAQESLVSAHADRAVELASVGPANAVAALMALCALDSMDRAFDVANAYYLGHGSGATPLRSNASDPSVSDQHRRVTQPLFIPSARRMREDPRFSKLCEAIGLTAYWDRFCIVPDFLQRA